jgi:hypothetical protein
MKNLTSYSKNKYDFTIFHREGDLAIFKGASRETGRDNWEVIKIQKHDGLTMGGVFMPPAEFAPSNKQWGVKGWTAINEEDAWRIFSIKKDLPQNEEDSISGTY